MSDIMKIEFYFSLAYDEDDGIYMRPLSPAEAVESHGVGRICRQQNHEMDAIPFR